MSRRIFRAIVVAMLVVMSVPGSMFAQQLSGTTTERTERTQPSAAVQNVEGTHHLDWQSAVRRILLDSPTPRQQALRQTETTSGGGLNSRQKLIVTAIIVGAAVGILALENTAPKGSDARCSSTNPQFCN